VRQAFDGLSYTHCKEYERWIEEAKSEETRSRRVQKSVELLPRRREDARLGKPPSNSRVLTRV
jgi:uncharacterized protein YdeI (YjbR/CyaY-like superfamily)